jgi:hypothetical protein
VSSLLEHHAEMLAHAAISETIAAARGYWSATQPKQLDLWFGPTQRKLVPALVIPTHDVNGEVAFCQLRPDEPRTVDGRVRKYELPRGARMAVDVPPTVRPLLGDPSVPLIITEGVKKADAAVTAGLHAIDLVGVWTWRGRNDEGGLTALADFESIAFNERVVYLAFDSDAMTKRAVYQALERFAAFLRHRRADVRFVYLPFGEGGAKTGLDDFLAAGRTRDEVVALASDQLRAFASDATAKVAPTSDAALIPTAELVAEVQTIVARFVVLPSRAASLALATFVLHTYAFAAAHATPYLILDSAVKRSGKTRAEEVLELLVRRPWRIAAASESALFRKIDEEQPTLLLDEVDALFARRAEANEPIRAILNAGHRPGAAVARVTGEGAAMTVRDYFVYCPKVLAGIATERWPDTVTDRAIPMRLRRRYADERVERFRYRSVRAETDELRARLARWADEHLVALRDAEPELPRRLNDRAAEVWEPLLAIAELADHETGGDLAEQLRAAALALSGEREADGDADHRIAALVAIKRLFDLRGADTIKTETITIALNADDDLPFGDYRRSAGINGRGLAKLLRPFGIRPRNVRIEGKIAKGYRRDDFIDSWRRYLPREQSDNASGLRPPDFDPLPPLHPNNAGEFRRPDDPLQAARVADGPAGENTREHGDVADVADANGHAGNARVYDDPPGGKRQLTIDEATEGILATFPGSSVVDDWPVWRAEDLADDRDEDRAEALDPITRAVAVIACCLAGWPTVVGRWWASAPIRHGLERAGIDDEAVIRAALDRLGVEVRNSGAHGQRWRLASVPNLPPPPTGGSSPCACTRRDREWRLVAAGVPCGPWTCALCHPPAPTLEVQWR